MRSSFTVLHIGPLYSIHLARWAELTKSMGIRVLVAGHLRPGRSSAIRTETVDEIHQAPASAPDIQDPPPAWVLDLEGPAPADCADGRRRSSAREVDEWASWLRILLSDTRPDVVHAHWLPGWGAAAGLAGCRPLVVSAWGSDVYHSGQGNDRLVEVALEAADRVLAPSPHLLRELRGRGVPAERLALVDLGVDLGIFHPASPKEIAAARTELGLLPGPVVLSFRAGQPLYNLPVVVEAFERLQRRYVDAQLVIARGSRPPDPQTARALERAAAHPRVDVAGDVPHERMALYFRATDVGVSIPSSDGSPRSVWECLASGRPVIASDLPQIRERVAGNPAVRLVEIDGGRVASALADLLGSSSAADVRAAAARRWAVANVDCRVQRRRLGALYRVAAAG